MNLPNAAPGEGPMKTRDNFSHWSIGAGEKHNAYVAGPTRWIIGHASDKGSKPCLNWLTKGALPCRFCHLGKCPCELGYVPVYRAIDWRPLLVIVYGDDREWTEKFETHTRVAIGRERERGARVWVRPCLDQEPAFNSTIVYRKCAQDCQHSLLTLWKMPELVAWLKCGESSDNALSLDRDQPAVKPAAKPADAHKPDAQPYTAPGDGAMLGGTDAAVNRLKEHAAKFGGRPSANGKHDGEG